SLDDLVLPDFMYARDSEVAWRMPTRAIGELVRDATIEFAVGWSEREQYPYVATYAVEVNGELIGRLEHQPGRKGVELTGLNWMHSIFSDLPPDSWRESGEHPLFSHYLRAF